MFAYIFKRLLLMIPTLLGVMLITFVVMQFVPGGPVEQMIAQLEGTMTSGAESAGGQAAYRGAQGVSEEDIEQIKKLYGFDKPAHERFIQMIGNYLRFNFGESFFYDESVIGLIKERLPVSVTLGLWTFLLTYLISIPLGIRKAVSDGSTFDVVTTVIVLIGYAIPGFVLGVMLLVLFGGGSFWDVFPLRGLTSENFDELSTWGQIKDYLWHITLPVIASTIGSFAVMTLLTKNSFIEELSQQYVLTARAKGLSERRVLYGHVFRNAMIPLVTGFPSAFIGAFFASSLLIEQIFSLEGLGLLSYEAVMQRDYPIVLGTLYIFTLMGLVAKLITDVSYVLIDPRISFASVK